MPAKSQLRQALVKCFACMREVQAVVEVRPGRPTEFLPELTPGQKCSRCKSGLDACRITQVLDIEGEPRNYLVGLV